MCVCVCVCVCACLCVCVCVCVHAYACCSGIYTPKKNSKWLISTQILFNEKSELRLENCIHCTFFIRNFCVIISWYFFASSCLITLSSSSCRATSTDIHDPLLSLIPIVHRFWQVLRATPRILTELLYVGSSWSFCFCSAVRRGP